MDRGKKEKQLLLPEDSGRIESFTPSYRVLSFLGRFLCKIAKTVIFLYIFSLPHCPRDKEVGG
jgi:hypothetical protein